MYQCPEGSYSYIIQSGDTLWLLAQRFQTTVGEIMDLNPGINPNNLFVGQMICIPYHMPIQPQPITQPQPEPQTQPPQTQLYYLWISKAEQRLNNYLRQLWMQQAYWTRMAIRSLVFDLPDAEVVNNRLMRVPKDFELALRSFYGEESARQLGELLTSHLTIANELFNAIKAGDQAAADDAEKRWYENADQIAAILGSVNPYWQEEDIRQALYDYLENTKLEAVAMMTENYQEGINLFGNAEEDALEMADMMAQGLVRQFPQYFR